MNLRSVDLNLLVVLDALLDEAHVSRAATRLGLSQPATSSALDRCRHLFGDELLMRAKGGMRLTPKAEALREPLKDALAGVMVLLAPEAPALGEIKQTVRIVMADYPAVVVAGPLHRKLAASAPGIDIVIEPWRGANEALEGLARGTLDLAVSVFPAIDVSYRRVELLRETYLVAMDKHHPTASSFDFDRWLAYPHILVSGRGATHGALDEALADRQRHRRVGIVVPSFQMVPPLLVGSLLIAMLPSRCLPADADETLAVFQPPIPIEGFPLHLAWHHRRDKDPAVQHVASVLQSLLSSDGEALQPLRKSAAHRPGVMP